MNKEKQAKLEAAGWTAGDTYAFLLKGVYVHKGGGHSNFTRTGFMLNEGGLPCNLTVRWGGCSGAMVYMRLWRFRFFSVSGKRFHWEWV